MPKAKIFENNAIYMKNFRKENAEKIAAYNKEYAKKNKETIKEKRKIRSLKNKNKIIETTNAWKDKNKDRIREYNREYTLKRYNSDPVFKLKLNQRTRTRAVLKTAKSTKTSELLGCSYEELKIHIEQLFINNMSWENMGKWHIDHIVPLAAFDLTKKENQIIAFNYKNLQPLWAIDNLKKGAKYA
jgi:hypothetical protein